MEQLERRRSASKGWATRTSKSLRTLLTKDDVSKEEVTDALQDLEKRVDALDAAQTELELHISDSAKLDDDIEAAAEYRRQVRAPIVLATQKLQVIVAAEEGESARSNSGSSGSLL